MKVEQIVLEKVKDSVRRTSAFNQDLFNKGHQWEEQCPESATDKEKELYLWMHKQAEKMGKELMIAYKTVEALDELYRRDEQK